MLPPEQFEPLTLEGMAGMEMVVASPAALSADLKLVMKLEKACAQEPLIFG